MAHSITHARDTGVLAGFGGLLERLQKRYADYRLYRKTLAELEALNERELDDLGLSQLVIREIAWEAVYSR